jgi:drug/metabolite transporter (DMT)-like permease
MSRDRPAKTSLAKIVGAVSGSDARSVVLLLETPVAALTAWSLMGQRIVPGTVPGLLLIIAGTVLVVKSSSGENTARR